MHLETLDESFTICQVADYAQVDWSRNYVFAAKSEAENSLVCPSDCVPANVTARDDGWRGFRIAGVLDFSLIGILSRYATVLTEAKIALFAVSTFNTDYLFVKAENFDRALACLQAAGLA